MHITRKLAALALSLLCFTSAPALAQSMQEVLGAGDSVRITAFRYPEMTTEARLTEEGKVTVPLIGQVSLQGMTPDAAARHIEERLKSGKYILSPQITVAVVEARSRQVSVLGFVNTPGRYKLEGTTTKVTDLIATAGGLVPEAADTAVVQRTRNGKNESLRIDLNEIIQGGDISKDIEVASGDSVFVPKAPVVYVYGEVTRGGSYRIEKGMTVMQALTVAGGVTPRGSERRMKLRRKAADGSWTESNARPHDVVAADDVLFVRESLF